MVSVVVSALIAPQQILIKTSSSAHIECEYVVLRNIIKILNVLFFTTLGSTNQKARTHFGGI